MSYCSLWKMLQFHQLLPSFFVLNYYFKIFRLKFAHLEFKGFSSLETITTTTTTTTVTVTIILTKRVLRIRLSFTIQIRELLYTFFFGCKSHLAIHWMIFSSSLFHSIIDQFCFPNAKITSMPLLQNFE